MVEQIALSTNKIHKEDSHCFKPLYERSNNQLLSLRILSIAFYNQKMSKTEILKPIGASTREIYH